MPAILADEEAVSAWLSDSLHGLEALDALQPVQKSQVSKWCFRKVCTFAFYQISLLKFLVASYHVGHVASSVERRRQCAKQKRRFAQESWHWRRGTWWEKWFERSRQKVQELNGKLAQKGIFWSLPQAWQAWRGRWKQHKLKKKLLEKLPLTCWYEYYYYKYTIKRALHSRELSICFITLLC